MYDALEALPQIVIAALNGARARRRELSSPATSGLAAGTRRSRCPRRCGALPRRGGPVRLPMLVGRRAGAGDHVHGARARRRRAAAPGLVLACTGGPTARRGQALAARIAASGPLATRGAKRIVTRACRGFGEARSL